ncbi:hypothetical protein H257_14207 [Aphanomyces astaci]|uniref:Uncharacterized protein n=1 Tax=Aphanomyces astaci TaxID=112090 RepID=W4FRS6_APHAT|nr:hypothetical protein H257_14207 [Aphanomyces astaci]ETV70172.1 hypothetical protein H257_14207 [Aphanomyces astaci]|eukprot:XP_009840269.1 hypothetical protein H257_14207 [Aphanomyces astaci]
MARDVKSKPAVSLVRQKLFRATAGMTLHEQSQLASTLETTGNNVLEAIQKMKKATKAQQKHTKHTSVKFEWLHDLAHLRKLEDTATKELDALLIKYLNDATTTCSSGQSCAPAPHHNNDPTTPHSDGLDDYGSALQSFVDHMQHHRLDWIKQMHAHRDTRHSMHQLVARVHADKAVQGPTWMARVKADLQNVMIDAIVGHHVVWEQLATEASATIQTLTATTVTLQPCLRSMGHTNTGNQDMTETDDHKSILDKLGGVECPDVALKASLQVQLDAIHQRHSHELQQLHQTFLAQCGEPNATVAMSKTGGWSDHDHDRYIKLFKDCDPKGIRNDPFLSRVAAQLTNHNVDAIRHHDTWYRCVRRVATLKQDRLNEHARRIQSFLDEASAAMAAATAAAVSATAKDEEWAQRMADQALMHAKVERFKGKRDAKADMAAHQAEIARLEADAIQVAADRKRLKEHELKKKLLQDHRSWQRVDMLAQDEATALKRAIEVEELKERDAVNAERVAFRVEEYEQKCDDAKRRAIQRADDEAERLRVLEAIKQETPYAEKLNQIEMDPERTRQPTVAFTANVDAIQDGLGVHETGLFPSHGYDTDKLFKDARFKLGLALRDAGLGSTDYARKAMSTITVRNTGAYRHTPQAPTQLW